MPELGTISARNREGLKGGSRIVWAACPTCGAERWVMLNLYRKREGRVPCIACTCRSIQPKGAKTPKNRNQKREANNSWKGGRTTTPQGYVLVLLETGDPLRCMANADGYVMEHRLVVARALGRPLERREQVHHRNGRKGDNRLENLEIWLKWHPAGIRPADYHCPGCRCKEMDDERPEE